MFFGFKKKIKIIGFWLLVLFWFCYPLLNNNVYANAPTYKEDFSSHLTKYNWVHPEWVVSADKSFRENIISLFYPRDHNTSKIYEVLRDITLWVMIAFIVVAWASLLLNKKPEESKKNLRSLMYILLWWVFIYAANWIFWSVFNFTGQFTASDRQGLGWFTDSLIWRVFFVVLSAVKAFAFFLAIIMTVVTWFRVIAAWEWDKWKKLVKWIINVVVSLLIIKWVDFIYYMAADSNFVSRTSDFIIDVAKVFAYIYWVIIVIMVIVSWYLYMTDWWSWSNFKKASNILINILLSALVLFAFLLITYQIFAEFQTWWDAVTESTAYIWSIKSYLNHNFV